MGRTWPNPPVGAYLLCRTTSNEIISYEGYTEKPGRRHAEIVLLDDFDQHREEVERAVLFVTLEPCSTYGRTPPCVNRIVNYDFIKTVVVMNRDPLLSGEGIRILKENGKNIIEPKKKIGPDTSDPFLGGFLGRVNGTGPRLHLKAAAYADGMMGRKKERIRISGEESFRFGMALRAKMDAVLVGPGTISVDHPGLNLRKSCKGDGNIVFEKIKGNDRFIDALLSNSGAIENLNYDDADYEPERVFILDRAFDGCKEFYAKQKQLEKITGKKSVFYITESSKSIWTDFEIDAILPDLKKENFSGELRRRLSERGYNEVLVEGGAGLFNSMKFLLHEHDRVYLLTSKQFYSGDKSDAVYLPEFLLKREPVSSYRLGEDDLIVS